MLHPDPHVPTVMVRAGAIKRSRWVSDTLYQRGMRDLAVEGGVWSPLLDALATHRAWPAEEERNPHTGIARDWAVDEPELPLRYEWRSREELAELLAPWVRAQSDPRSFRVLFDFQAKEIMTVLAREARVFDQELARRLCDAAHRSQHVVREALLQNPHLPSAILEEIQWWILRGLTSGPSGELFGQAVEHPVHPVELMEAAAKAGRQPTTEMLGHLMDMVRHVRAREILVSHWIDTSPEMLATVVASEHALTTNQTTAIDHPRANSDVWRALARKSTDPTIQVRLASNDGAVRDPVVREILSRSAAPVVIEGLLRFAEVDEVEALFGRLRKLNPESASVVLRNARQEPDVYRALLTLPASIVLDELRTSCWYATLSAALFPTPWPTADEEEVRLLRTESRARIIEWTAGFTRTEFLKRVIGLVPGVLGAMMTPKDLPALLASDSAEVRTAAILAAEQIQSAQSHAPVTVDTAEEAARPSAGLRRA